MAIGLDGVPALDIQTEGFAITISSSAYIACWCTIKSKSVQPWSYINYKQLMSTGHWLGIFRPSVTDKNEELHPMSRTFTPLTFLITLADVDQFAYFTFFTVKFRKEVWMKLNLKPTPPQICCLTMLKKSSDQLYSFYSTDNLGQGDAKTFNYGKRQRGMLIPWLSVHINIQHVFKMSAVVTYAYLWVVHTIGQWMRQLCIVQCCAKHLST